MIRFGFACVLMLSWLTYGCVVPALSPCYSNDTLQFDPALLGTWTTAEGGAAYTFMDLGDGSYQLTIAAADEKQTSYICHLASVGGRTLLDLYPQLSAADLTGYAPWNYAPVHSVFIIEQIRPTLHFTMFKPDWVGEYLSANPQETPHGLIDLGDGNSLPILTGSTAELQWFYTAHAGDPGACYDTYELISSDYPMVIPEPLPGPIQSIPEPIPGPIQSMPEPIPGPIQDMPEPMPAPPGS